MRLFKLLAYMLIGYALYELWQGMKESPQPQMAGRARQGRQSDLGRALNEDTGRRMNMTGPGRGTTVTTEDGSGTSIQHTVGRGVTSR